jgi:hypothetical protein
VLRDQAEGLVPLVPGPGEPEPPEDLVYGDDIDQATELANDLATLKSSGVLGLPRPGEPTANAFEVPSTAHQQGPGYGRPPAWRQIRTECTQSFEIPIRRRGDLGNQTLRAAP